MVIQEKNILILGGTRFIGKRLVNTFLKEEEKSNLYILSRNKCRERKRLKYIVSDIKFFSKRIPDIKYEYVFDFISKDLKVLDKIISKINFKNYYFISTSWVTKSNKKNKINKKIIKNFTPQVKLNKKNYFYIKRKIKLENFLINKFNKLEKNLVILRFPIVIGKNDYTSRLRKIYKRIKLTSNFKLLDTEKKINLIWIKDLVKSIYELTKLKITKRIQIIECLNSENISYKDLVMSLYKRKFRLKYNPKQIINTNFEQKEFDSEIKLLVTKDNLFLKTNIRLTKLNKIILNEKI